MRAETMIIIIICIALFCVVALWVSGIDYMQKNHPDYKGNDFFNELDGPDFSHEENDLYYDTKDNEEEKDD
jgi:hypothetical protein